LSQQPVAAVTTHLHTNSTQNKTISSGRVRTVPRLCELYPAFALQLRKNHGKNSVRVNEECQLADENRIYGTEHT